MYLGGELGDGDGVEQKREVDTSGHDIDIQGIGLSGRSTRHYQADPVLSWYVKISPA